ncbi:MAG: M48 family metalloprotease [Gammaproteobacteria bacterium]|jgi:Zn-dependent protease with chaperone function|nr:M48 family metalloprotease [Gammaproteobacteria bacterium]
MRLNPFETFNEYINVHIQSIEKRQLFYNWFQLLWAALNIGLCSYLLGTPLLTLLYSSIIIFNIPIDISVWFITLSAYCFALFELKPLYYDKIKKIDSFKLAPEKITFIKNQVSKLTQRAGISLPEIYVNENETSLNAEFKWSLFTEGKIILTAGLLRSFGFGETTKRDLRATIAHELGHKIGKDFQLMMAQAFIIATTVGIYLSLIIAMIDLSLQLMTLSLMTSAAIPLAVGIVGLFIYGAISSSVFLQYRKNMESAADIRGVHLTNDVEGMTKSNKNMKIQGRNLAIYSWLSLFNKTQVRNFLSSIKKIGSNFQYEQLKNILTSKIPFKEKEKALINSSFLDKDWQKKFKAPAQQAINKHYDTLLEKANESYSSENKGYFTRFQNRMIYIMNPYPSTKQRNNEVRKNFHGRSL